MRRIQSSQGQPQNSQNIRYYLQSRNSFNSFEHTYLLFQLSNHFFEFHHPSFLSITRCLGSDTILQFSEIKRRPSNTQAGQRELRQDHIDQQLTNLRSALSSADRLSRRFLFLGCPSVVELFNTSEFITASLSTVFDSIFFLQPPFTTLRVMSDYLSFLIAHKLETKFARIFHHTSKYGVKISKYRTKQPITR